MVFFTPVPGELNGLELDHAARDGIHQALGDFAYYASLVADSLSSSEIPVYFTDKRHLTFANGSEPFKIDRDQSEALFGLVLYNGLETPKLMPGMQTHLSMLASIEDYFYDHEPIAIPLLDYFDSVMVDNLHIYSSHSDILNQTGKRIDPSHYRQFGSSLAKRASKFRMSVYAYEKFILTDALVAIICRVPSRYDESSVRLYIWDEQTEMVISEIELAENVWNENWIMVKDSWITASPTLGQFFIVQREKEARMVEGNRMVADSLFRWQWTGSEFKRMSIENLVIEQYPLQDWDSFQEPKVCWG